jgi:hypothetical protein
LSALVGQQNRAHNLMPPLLLRILGLDQRRSIARNPLVMRAQQLIARSFRLTVLGSTMVVLKDALGFEACLWRVTKTVDMPQPCFPFWLKRWKQAMLNACGLPWFVTKLSLIGLTGGLNKPERPCRQCPVAMDRQRHSGLVKSENCFLDKLS